MSDRTPPHNEHEGPETSSFEKETAVDPAEITDSMDELTDASDTSDSEATSDHPTDAKPTSEDSEVVVAEDVDASTDAGATTDPEKQAEGADGNPPKADARDSPDTDAASESETSCTSEVPEAVSPAESSTDESSPADTNEPTDDKTPDLDESGVAGATAPGEATTEPAPKAAPVWYMPEPSDRPLPWLSWYYSLIFVFALLGVIATSAYVYFTRDDDTPAQFTFRVVDEQTTPIPGATIHLGSAVQTTDAEGTALLPQGAGVQPISVERDGYITVEGTVDPADGNRREIMLHTAASPAASPASTPMATPGSALATPDSTASANLRPGGIQGLGARELAGRVVASDGTPIQGARVNAGSIWSVTGADGIYLLQRAAIDIHEPIHVFAAGYVDAAIIVPPLGNALDITLQPRMIKAIYLNPTITDTPDEINALIAIADTTEINAIVIDIKEELVFYDTQVPLFRESGTVDPILDLPTLLATLHERGIYTIARLVVFKDSFVAENNPALAIRSTATGDAWRDQNGVAWVNPMNHELWEANTALAVEAAHLGFDEIQFDYVRFPTDGDLSTMDFGAGNTQANRERTITGFVDYAWQRLIPTGAKLSADIFGYTLMVQDDLGIGQNVNKLASHIDYLSPMVYPSHYGKSFQGYSPPVEYPSEVVGITLKTGLANHDLNAKALRPWLQDFDYSPDDMPYGAREVRAQIDAAESSGASGWMLWTLGNPITVDALKPESGSGQSGPDHAIVVLIGMALYDPVGIARFS